MSSYFALWRAILHAPFSPLPLQTSYTCCLTCNALYVIASENTGTPRDTVYSRGKGINKQKTSIFAFCIKWLVKSAVYDVFRATHFMSLRHHILVVLRATHFMSLRAQRGTLIVLRQRTLCHCEEHSDVAISRKGYHVIHYVIASIQKLPRLKII